MDQAIRTRFHRELVALFRTRLPDETHGIDDAALLALVIDADHRAATYGIDTERGIAEFVGLTLIGGKSFDLRPRMHRYLTDSRIPAITKLDLLLTYLASGAPRGSAR